MKYFKHTLVALLIFTVIGCTSSNSSVIRENRSVLVLIDDSDADAVSFNSSIARRVVDVVSEQLSQQGFRVFDQSVLSGTSRRVSRMNVSELIEMGRSNATFPGSNRVTNIDILATISIHVNVQPRANTTQATVRVNGRLVSINSGKFLGNYELSDPVGRFRVHPSCDFSCLTEELGSHARVIGQAVGNELANTLRVSVPAVQRSSRNSPPGSTVNNSTRGSITDYAIRFDNIDDQQYLALEEYMTDVFSGFVDLQLVNSAGTVHNISYHSRISTDHLLRNIRHAMDELGWRGGVFQDGNLITITRSATRGRRSQDDTQRGSFYDW